MIDLRKTYSGGLTIQDLREAWLLVEPTLTNARTPRNVVLAIQRDWRRSEGAVRQIVSALKRMHEGRGPAPTELGSLWRMTEAERRYVFTGLDGEPGVLELTPTLPVPADDVPIVAALRDLESAVRELIQVWK